MTDDKTLNLPGTINANHTTTGRLTLNANTSSTNGGTLELYGPTELGRESEVALIGSSIVLSRYSNPDWLPSMQIDANGHVAFGKAYPWANVDVLGDENAAGSTTDFRVARNNGINGETTLFSIKDNGQVGINWDFPDNRPNNSDYKLCVNGKIFTQGETIKLSQYWPDYVFKKNYPLQSLGELELFIKNNGHLPLMPDAGTVQENGMDVEQINIALVRNVEELTLYVIQLQNEIDELNKRIK